MTQTDTLAEARPGPLQAEHLALGAAMTPFAGWSMPLRYTSDLAEHHAVRTAAGLFDLSHMGEVRVAGSGAGRALDLALVGDLSGLAPGRARYTMLCAPDGGVLDDLFTYRLGERFLTVTNAANHERDHSWFAEHAAEADGATVEDAAELGLTLEPVYTGKALAAMRDLGAGLSAPVLWLQTHGPR